MTRRRRLAVAATLVVLYFVVLALVGWLLGRDVGKAFLFAFMYSAAASVGWVVGTRVPRAMVTRGRLDVAVRSSDDIHRLSSRWQPAEFKPTGDGLRIFPQAGPSVAPFTIKADAVEEFEDPGTWRDVLTWPVGYNTFVRIIAEHGTVEIALRPEHLQQLLDALDPDRTP